MSKYKEKLEFSEWFSEIEDPKYPVYIISGGHHWTKEFMKNMKDKFNTDYRTINKDVKENTKLLNYKSLNKSKHLVMFESIDNITKKEMNELVEYIKKPSKHAIFVLSIRNWKEKREVLSQFRYLGNSKTIKYFELDFPSYRFMEAYIRHKSKEYGLKYASPDVFGYLFRRLHQSPENVVDNIHSLSVIGGAVTKEMVNEYTEDYSTYTYSKLYSALSKLNRKKVPYIAYNDLIDSGRKETTIMNNMRKHYDYLLQAKYLKLSGILRNNDIIDVKKHLYEKGDIKFNEDTDIFKLHEFRINYYLKESDSITLKEIINILQIIDYNMPSITFIRTEDNPNKRAKRESEIAPYKTLLEILNRRND